MDMDNRRRTSSYTATVPSNDWPGEMYPNSIRYVNSYSYPCDHTEEHDAKILGEKSSEKTVVEVEETGANKNNFYRYQNEPVNVNTISRHGNNIVSPRRQRRFNDYSERNVSEAVIAMQKLQKLKELQIKRDISERYYSQQMKRLIDEHYLGRRMLPPSFRLQRRLQSASYQPLVEDREKIVPSKSLEPCGTMTTITKLDCGCIQKTTRTIFTMGKARIQRKNCNKAPNDGRLLKLTLSNPQEHLLTSLEQNKDMQRLESKKRLFVDPRSYPKIPSVDDDDFETEIEKPINAQELEVPDRVSRSVSRSVSPCEKLSDTSITSI